MTRGLLILAVAAMAAPAFGQTNLLVNPSFSDPPAVADCGQQDQGGPPTGWFHDTFGNTPIINGSYYVPPCGANHNGDSVYAGFQTEGGTAYGRCMQTVTLPTPADGIQAYNFSGEYFLGSTGTLTAKLGIWLGAAPKFRYDASREFSITNSAMSDWAPFTVTIVPTAGTTQLTVSAEASGLASNHGMHFDNMALVLETECPTPPILNSVSPTRKVRGTSVDLILSGSDFSDAAGTPTVQLTGPQTIEATLVTVDSSEQVTAHFDLPADAVTTDDYSVVYSQTGCAVETLPNVFLIYLPALTNASFEDPASTTCEVPLAVVPAEWRPFEWNSWGWEGRLQLNGYAPGDPLAFKPSCPAKDGVQYGTMAQNGANGAAKATQTFTAAASTKYSLSGYWAGSGENNVTLRLRDGGPNGALLSTKEIHTGAGDYDWQFSYISAETGAGSDAVTVEWEVAATGGAQNASHADALVFEECVNVVTSVDSIAPTLVTNDAPVTGAVITGGGFVSGATVLLTKPGNTIVANVANVAPTEITCDFDPTGAPAGSYEVVVKQGGCIGSLADGLLVVASEFVNGSFEDPTAPVDHGNCILGDPPQIVGGVPTGWITDTNLLRDGNAPLPPNDGAACIPSTDGGHYGTMSNGNQATQRAWQTIKVEIGQRYKFSGSFAGPTSCSIRLIDGQFDPNNPETAVDLTPPVVVYGAGATTWTPGEIVANATSEIMTVMWEIQGATQDAPGGHADGLSFASDCHVVWADTDDDGDVDMDDFAFWQRCIDITGSAEVDPYCPCLDRAPPSGVEPQDFAAFSACASGPGIILESCP